MDREKILQTAQKYVSKKKYDKAIIEYQKIVQKDPNDARTLLKIGDLQSRLGLFAEAIGTYDRVGEFYSRQGFALKAIAVYKQIRELIKKHAPQLEDRYGHITPKLAEIYTQLGLTSDALAAYDEVAARLQKAGRDRDAIDIFKRMVSLDATNPLPHLRFAEACCRVQSLDEAVNSFWTAAELLIKLGRRDDALKVIERILHFRPEPRFAKVAAELYLARETHADGMQALAKLQLCFQHDPKDLKTLELLARAFGNIDQAPKALEVKKEIARVAKDQGKTDLHRQTVQFLLKAAPHDDQVRAMASQLGEEEAESVSEIESVASAPAQSRNAMPTVPSSVEVEVEEIDFDEAPVSRAVMTSSPELDVEVEDVTDLEMEEVRESSVVVVEDELEAIEELSELSTVDADAQVNKALADAESFRGLRLYSKAIETLSIALELDPMSVPLRQKLRDVLAESGDRDTAIGEMISIASIYMEQGHLGSAEVELYNVLELEPDHALACEMLEQLGGFAEAPVEPYSPYTEDTQSTTADTRPNVDAGVSPIDADAPLPSYDLEEINADAVLVAEEVYETQDAPLPSFPLGLDDNVEAHLEAEKEAHTFEAGEVNTIDPAIPSQTGVPSPGTDFSNAATVASPDPRDPAVVEAVEEALEEADFFATQGLVDDARAILTDQLDRTPNHPLLLERLRELDKISAQNAESGTRERPELEIDENDFEEDDAFDIAASLDALDDLEEVASAPPASLANPEEEVDVETVFVKFKEGVAREVSESDSSTHYDLGVAYREMGLHDDAVTEFEMSARDPKYACTCYAMIGMIHLEQGDLDKAAEAYVHGLAAPQKTVDQEMSLYYDLGIVYEMKQSTSEAIYYFNKIARRDPGFRDVRERIENLEGRTERRHSRRPIEGDNEFDAAFDDLFESK